MTNLLATVVSLLLLAVHLAKNKRRNLHETNVKLLNKAAFKTFNIIFILLIVFFYLIFICFLSKYYDYE